MVLQVYRLFENLSPNKSRGFVLSDVIEVAHHFVNLMVGFLVENIDLTSLAQVELLPLEVTLV